jgi:hypothetical protein
MIFLGTLTYDFSAKLLLRIVCFLVCLFCSFGSMSDLRLEAQIALYCFGSIIRSFGSVSHVQFQSVLSGVRRLQTEHQELLFVCLSFRFVQSYIGAVWCDRFHRTATHPFSCSRYMLLSLCVSVQCGMWPFHTEHCCWTFCHTLLSGLNGRSVQANIVSFMLDCGVIRSCMPSVRSYMIGPEFVVGSVWYVALPR